MTALRMASPEAWRQRHSPTYQHTADDFADGRKTCPCCWRLLSRQHFLDIWGCYPEDWRQGVEAPRRHSLGGIPDVTAEFTDPTDQRWFWHDERSAR